MLNLTHQYLIDWSTAISMFVVVILFLFLFEPRYPKKKYLASLIPFMTVWFGVNLGILFFCGIEVQGTYSFLTASIPSLVYFWLVAKDRGGRFFFTFCLVDTVMIWVMVTTGLIDYFAGSEGIVNFVTRIIAFPIMMYVTLRYVRKPYLRLLNSVSKGWWLFAGMTGLFYLTLVIVGGVPTNLRLRPEDMPVAIMTLILLPLTYVTIFRVLSYQQTLFEVQENRRMLDMQTITVEQRAEEFRRMEEKVRIERHDLRHRFQTIYTMLQNGQVQEAMAYIDHAQSILRDAKVTHYCTHPILDAILAAYFQKAKDLGIQVEAQLAIPDDLPVSPAELSSVFANALENMINAVQALPRDQRRIVCKCIDSPRLMIEFSNPCGADVEIGPDGLPVSPDSGHGIGTHSIAAFADKHNAICSFRVENGWFKLQLAL